MTDTKSQGGRQMTVLDVLQELRELGECGGHRFRDRMKAAADTIQALQERCAELEGLWRNGDLVVNEALSEAEYQRVLRVLHQEPGGIMTPHGLAPQEPELVLKNYPPVKYCSLCGSLVTTCVHTEGPAPGGDQ